MYIGPRPNKRRRSSPVRILFLLLLIGGAIYVYAMIQQEQIESPFIPTPTPTRSALSYVAEADDLYMQGKLPQSIAIYSQAIALEPDNVLLYIPVVRMMTLEGRTVEAVRLGEQIVERAPENARAWAVLGMAYDWNGDVPEAISACKEAIELDPTLAEAYAYLAEAYVDVTRWAEANDVIQTALQLDERNVDVLRNYGYVLEVQGNYWEAIEAYKRAVELHPNLGYLYLSIGRNYSALGDLDAATRSYETAIEADPNNVEAYYRLGRAYYDVDEYEQAETYLAKAIEIDPDFDPAYGYLAFNYWRRRNYEDSIPNFERAIGLACIESRRDAESFYITLEDQAGDGKIPTLPMVMEGDFDRASGLTAVDAGNVLQASLAPRNPDDAAWAAAEGQAILDAVSGQYTVTLQGIPASPRGQVYVGWFDGVNALSGSSLSTGPLSLGSNGSLEATFEARWVDGPNIGYFYTLGLAYFYMAECEKSYPLFDAALQIDPYEANALEGIRLCQEAELGEDGTPNTYWLNLTSEST